MPGRILIAHDDVAARIVLKARFHLWSYAVEMAFDLTEIAAALALQDFDAVLISETNAAKVIETIRRRPNGSSIAIIVLTTCNRRSVRLQLLEDGADAVLDPKTDEALMHAKLRNLMRRRVAEQELTRDAERTKSLGFAEPATEFTGPGQIAIIAPSEDIGRVWKSKLSTRIRDQITVYDPDRSIIELQRGQTPDAILIAETPHAPDVAYRILSELRSYAATMRSVSVVIQSRPADDQAIRLLELDVNDVTTGPFDTDEITLILRRELSRKARHDHCRAALQNSLHMAITDPLTGLYNRRYALNQLESITKSASETHERFAVMVLDLDRFKRINDSFGHTTGDAVLVETAKRLTACIRQDDFVARLGGEEFVAVIRDCDEVSAQSTAERLRRAIADHPIEVGGIAIDVTTSIGLVMGRAQSDPTTLIDRADKSLYVAKAEGRNQVTIHKDAA